MAQRVLNRLDEAASIASGRQLCELSAHVSAALADLVQLIAAFDASQLVRICRECRRSMDADAPGQDDRLRARRGLWTRRREDGMLRLDPRTGGAARLRRQHGERGLAIGPQTPVAGWGGERCDL